MRFLRTVQLLVLLTVGASPAFARDYEFEGTWNTTNRKLDGRMTCIMTDLGEQKWQGRFFGVWQGVPFDYSVSFSGPLTELRGTAVIDHANYIWAGRVDEGSPALFRGNFDGDRYRGSFELNERPKTGASPAEKTSAPRLESSSTIHLIRQP
jgi:hypothetical protein